MTTIKSLAVPFDYTNGTLEVVPLHKTVEEGSFTATCDVVP
jgi:hypothetical protein